MAVPALLAAVKQHSDQYVRFRALVILSGFNDPRTRDVMAAAVTDKNDRMRTVAYAYFERNPDKAVIPRLLEALKVEASEFVRPALTRALAAHADDPKVRQTMEGLVMQGQAFFRSVVIEAIGDHRGAYALKPITEVAKIDGPLQDDAVLALGKIGDKSVLPILAGLQRTAPRESQPGIAAAICLLGVNCASHQPYIVESLRFSIANLGFQALLRSSSARRWRCSPSPDARTPLAELVDAGRADARSRPRADRAGARHRRAAQHAGHPQAARESSRSATRRSSCCARPSTCSRRTSTRSSFSRPSGAPTGRRRPDRRRARSPTR